MSLVSDIPSISGYFSTVESSFVLRLLRQYLYIYTFSYLRHYTPMDSLVKKIIAIVHLTDISLMAIANANLN